MATPPSILDHIGRTPLVPLARLARGLPVPVLVKCEHMNPGGSVKDRIAKATATAAPARGRGRDRARRAPHWVEGLQRGRD